MRIRRNEAISILFVAVLGGCSDDATTTTDELLAPPAAGQGIQLQMVTSIEAGTEAEHCKFVKSPPEDIYIKRDEVRYTAGSHHFLLYLTPYDDIPTSTLAGGTVDTNGVFDCSNGPTQDWEVTKLIGGSQNATGESVIQFPPNVGMHIKANSVLLMNAHYINASPKPLEPEVRINLHTIEKSQVEAEGDVLFWYNMFIEVPGQSTGRARMRCQVDRDITITNMQSHMHAHAELLHVSAHSHTSPTRMANTVMKR